MGAADSRAPSASSAAATNDDDKPPLAVQIARVVEATQGQGEDADGALESAPRVGVAAKSAEHVVPIGPGSEKAWSILNRVDAKGSPLQESKGGSVFKNTDGKLPETPGV